MTQALLDRIIKLVFSNVRVRFPPFFSVSNVCYNILIPFFTIIVAIYNPTIILCLNNSMNNPTKRINRSMMKNMPINPNKRSSCY